MASSYMVWDSETGHGHAIRVPVSLVSLRIVEALRAPGQLDNTLIVFLRTSSMPENLKFSAKISAVPCV